MTKAFRRYVLLWSLVTVLWPVTARCQVNVLTYHNDNSRSGLNANETILTPANVNKTLFGKLFSTPVDGSVYTQPLYVANVSIPGLGVRNVVYVATEHDSVYAIDADVGVVLWSVSFLNPTAGITAVSNTTDLGCEDISPEVGITSTPVIDSSTGTLYVVAKTKETGAFFQRLHALDITTGTEKFGGPAVIQAAVSGAGPGSANGTVQFGALHENQRAALLFSNGVLYIGFGSHCDGPTYYGWLLAYDATTLQQNGAFNTTANAGKGGIWQAGGGIAADANGVLFFATSNGRFDANTGGVDYADSFLKLQLSPPFTVLDYFAPYNQASLGAANIDLGSGGVLLLPDQAGPYPHLMLAAGKQGVIYLLNRDNMGQFNATSNLIVQQLSGQTGAVYSTPALWQNNVYFGTVNNYLKVFTLTNGALSTTPASHAPTTFAFPSATPSVSANGSSNAIVWALQTSAFGRNGPAVLHAYDATNLATELYNSNQILARDNPGAAVKFSVPTIANGNVYVGAQQQVSGYGILPPDYFWMSASPAVQVVTGSGTASYTVSVNAMAGSTVSLSISGLAPGMTASFNPPSVNGSGTSTLTVASNSTPSANYVLTVSGTSSTRSWAATVAFTVQASLPSPWAQQDIGNVGVIGAATFDASTSAFTVQGSGTDIGGNADAFHFVYQPWSGDGQLIALVASEQKTSVSAKAGVMIRETLNAGSTHASMFLTPGHGVILETRVCTGCVSSTTSGPLSSAPYWVWIVRQGNRFSGYASSDGAHWSLLGSVTINMASTVYLGLAVTANTMTELNTSTFENVTVGPSPNFSLTATPGLATIAPASSATYNVTVNSFGGFADMVTLSATGLPSGVSASFNPTSILGSGASVLTVTASGSTPMETSVLSILGTSSTLSYKTSVALMTGMPLPSPWADQDVGNVYSPGGATYDNSSGTFAVAASANDIASTTDAFHFVYRPLSGDGQVIARIATQQNTNSWAKAGVMIRETLGATSRHSSMLLTPGNGIVFQRRTCTGCSSASTSGPRVKAPYWVKLVRHGTTFSGYVSADGANWTLVGSVTISMNNTGYIGFALTSHATVLNTSTFDNVQ